MYGRRLRLCWSRGQNLWVGYITGSGSGLRIVACGCDGFLGLGSCWLLGHWCNRSRLSSLGGLDGRARLGSSGRRGCYNRWRRLGSRFLSRCRRCRLVCNLLRSSCSWRGRSSSRDWRPGLEGTGAFLQHGTHRCAVSRVLTSVLQESLFAMSRWSVRHGLGQIFERLFSNELNELDRRFSGSCASGRTCETDKIGRAHV